MIFTNYLNQRLRAALKADVAISKAKNKAKTANCKLQTASCKLQAAKRNATSSSCKQQAMFRTSCCLSYPPTFIRGGFNFVDCPLGGGINGVVVSKLRSWGLKESTFIEAS